MTATGLTTLELRKTLAPASVVVETACERPRLPAGSAHARRPAPCTVYDGGVAVSR